MALIPSLRATLLIAYICCMTGVADAQLYHQYEDPFPDGANQAGLRVSYIRPRNAFGKDFKSAPCYELYYQRRSKDGSGPFSGRVGFLYMDFKPRMDTIPAYAIRESPTTVLPCYIVYTHLDFKGFFIDYAYSVVQFKRLRLDLGLGLIVGQYNIRYSEEYETLINVSNANLDERFVGLRPKIGIGCRLNKYLELYADYMDGIVTSTDWSSQFSHNSFGIGLNVTFNPKSNDNY